MGNFDNFDLICKRVLDEEQEQSSSSNVEISIPTNLDNINIQNSLKINSDEALTREKVHDLISNREQREKFTKQIIGIMCFEIIFIALLIMGVFITSFLNALAPKEITFSLPPLFMTLSLIVIYCYLYKTAIIFPNIRFSYKKWNINKIQLSTKHLFRVICTVLLIAILNIYSRDLHIIHYNNINLTDNIIHMILYTALAVFVKTTILAGYIIRGLYDALNEDKTNKKTYKNKH